MTAHDTPRTDERAGLSEDERMGLFRCVRWDADNQADQFDPSCTSAIEREVERIIADRLAAAVARAEAVRTTVSDQRESFLPSPGLDPAWVAGWHAAIDHAANMIEKALADVPTSAPTGEVS